MPEIAPSAEMFARIKVIGIGGGGCNAIARMIGSKIEGVDFVAINTDAQALHHSPAATKVHIGKETTKGLGAGADPGIGRAAAEENREEIRSVVTNCDMVFITCGLGGGTGTGAAAIVADMAKSEGALTVAIVTKPFGFEGERRRMIAEDGLAELRSVVDTLIVIPNDKILSVIDRKTSMLEAFAFVDDVLKHGIQGISDLITVNGVINLDFADVKSIMQEAGSALMGIGQASGDDRAVEAVRQAMESPLLDLSIRGARGVLINFTGGKDIGMPEISEATKMIHDAVDPEANIIWGIALDESMTGELRVTLLATGFNEDQKSGRSAFSGPANTSVNPSPGIVSSFQSSYNKASEDSSDYSNRFSSLRKTEEPKPLVNALGEDKEDSSSSDSFSWEAKLDSGSMDNSNNSGFVKTDSEILDFDSDSYETPAYLRQQDGDNNQNTGGKFRINRKNI